MVTAHYSVLTLRRAVETKKTGNSQGQGSHSVMVPLRVVRKRNVTKGISECTSEAPPSQYDTHYQNSPLATVFFLKNSSVEVGTIAGSGGGCSKGGAAAAATKEVAPAGGVPS